MSNFFKDLTKFVKDNKYNMFSIACIENGNEPKAEMLQEANPCQNSYSVAKAFTVTAIGMMYDKGLLTPDSLVVDLLGDECPKNLNKTWQKVTVHHLLTHSAGLPGGCLDIDCLDARTFGEDYLDYLMHLDFIYEPGEDNRYSDGAFYLLARIAEHLCRENLTTYLWKTLFFKLGFREVSWSVCPKGHSMGATGLYIRSEDMVKLGEVYLEGGTYHGERILSEEWVKLVLDAPYELSKCGIGNAYGKGGMNCQKLFVDPDSKRVIAYHSYGNVDNDAIIRFTVNYGK